MTPEELACLTPQELIHCASRHGVDLSVLPDGSLRKSSPSGPPPDALLTALRERKRAIVMALEHVPWVDIVRQVNLQRCLPLTPDDLTTREMREVHQLAGDLMHSGTLGQFIIDLAFTWNGLTERERLAAVCVWTHVVEADRVAMAA